MKVPVTRYAVASTMYSNQPPAIREVHDRLEDAQRRARELSDGSYIMSGGKIPFDVFSVTELMEVGDALHP